MSDDTPTPCSCPNREKLDAMLSDAIKRRSAVEQTLWDMALGKKPLPDRDKLRELAKHLGMPGSNAPGVGPIDEATKPPVRAFRLTLMLDADTRTDMADALRNMADRVDRDQVTNGVWGGPSDGAIYELLTDPTMTHDAYHAALRSYLDQRSKEQKRAMLAASRAESEARTMLLTLRNVA